LSFATPSSVLDVDGAIFSVGQEEDTNEKYANECILGDAESNKIAVTYVAAFSRSFPACKHQTLVNLRSPHTTML